MTDERGDLIDDIYRALTAQGRHPWWEDIARVYDALLVLGWKPPGAARSALGEHTRIAALEAALGQLRIDAGDAGMDDTVVFITAALAEDPT